MLVEIITPDAKLFEGEVINKRRENGKNLVDFELVAKNQDGELSAKGKATASLPSCGSK